LLPNALGVATLKKNVPSSFGLTLAELAGWLVRPTTDRKAVRGPKPILDGQLGEETSFWRGPRFPNNVLEGARN
jgi:hypothetical protein